MPLVIRRRWKTPTAVFVCWLLDSQCRLESNFFTVEPEVRRGSGGFRGRLTESPLLLAKQSNRNFRLESVDKLSVYMVA